MRKKKRETEVIGFTSEPSPAPRLTPMDVQQKEFRLAFRGYNERDVDEFLDTLTEELTAYLEENERLRQQSGLAPTGVESVPPQGAAPPDAEEAVGPAREQAAAIIKEAEARAAAILAAAGSGSVDHRAVLGPYLSREREFLQGLGQLVQEHAQTVRDMIQQARDSSVAVPSVMPGGAAPSESSHPETVTVADAKDATEEPPDAATTVRSQSSTGAAVASGDSEGAAFEREEPRSLRELFWGEG